MVIETKGGAMPAHELECQVDFYQRMELETRLNDAGRLLTAIDVFAENSVELQKPGDFEIVMTLLDRVSAEVKAALAVI